MSVCTFEEALAEVILRAGSLSGQRRSAIAFERLPLLDAAGRVLAEPVFADRDLPPFDRSTRDGFAVIAEDLMSGKELRFTGLVRAGDSWSARPMKDGEAIEIMTGAPLPPGADAVVMIEHVAVSAGALNRAVSRSLKKGDNVVPRGSEARQGDLLIPAGSLLGAAEIALAAACGYTSLRVAARPSIAIVATGDELVEVGSQPGPYQIRNSNGYCLAAMVEAAGGFAQRLEIARDTLEQLRERIEVARRCDLILLSGGVSTGKYDLVEDVLGECGAEFFFTGVHMQPGKPVVFGRLPEQADAPECFFFGLPGNPVSTQVTFHCFVEPFLRVLGGEDTSGPPFVQATLSEDVAGRSGLMRLLPARLDHAFRSPTVSLVGWQGSGDLAANARANCYAVLPPDTTGFRRGDVISVLLR